MKNLQDSDIVRIIREEYARKLKSLTENLDINLVSSGLKVRDKEDNQFTVNRVGVWGAELSYVDQNGKTLYKRVEKKDFEDNYVTPAEARKEGAKNNE